MTEESDTEMRIFLMEVYVAEVRKEKPGPLLGSASLKDDPDLTR